MRARDVLLAFLLLVCLTASCSQGVDVSQDLQLQMISSGWVAARTVDGRTKLVPSISFSLKNRSDRTLKMLQVNALFGRVGENDEWGSSFVTAASAGLAPGTDTGALTVTSPVGYTGLESRAALLGHSQFVDARVDLFAKYGSSQWTRLGRYPITREQLAR